jgi:hypothetical protein
MVEHVNDPLNKFNIIQSLVSETDRSHIICNLNGKYFPFNE